MAAQTTKITNIGQIVGSFVARVTSLETNAASGSSVPDSARSWNIFGQSTGSTATGSLGPMTLGHHVTIVIRGVDQILLQFLKTNVHGVPSDYDSLLNNTTKGIQSGSIHFWEESNRPAHNEPVRIHCKAGSVSARFVFETRAKCQDSVARFLKMIVSSYQLKVHSETPKQLSRSANSSHLKTRKS